MKKLFFTWLGWLVLSSLLVLGSIKWASIRWVKVGQLSQTIHHQELFLTHLAHTTILSLGRAVKTQEFDSFYSRFLAKSLRQEVTSAGIKQAFQEFIAVPFPAAAQKPAFSPFPEPQENRLLLRGCYPRASKFFCFKLKYWLEDSGWKLISIAVSTEKRL